MGKHKRRRMPKLSFTETQNIGYYASFRDPITNTPRRKRFGMVSEEEAKVLYTQWLAAYVGGEKATGSSNPPAPPQRSKPKPDVGLPGVAQAMA